MAAPDLHAPPLTVTLLGTGTSTGVPVIGCDCDVCTSDDPRDRRTRCACYVRAGALGILIDTGPDLRAQILREGVDRIDAVCYTHHHFDHLVGVDDLRPFFFWNHNVMPCYMQEATEAVMKRNYDYILGTDPYPGAANIETRVVEDVFCVTSRYDEGASDANGDASANSGSDPVPVRPLPLMHGEMPVYGFRIGAFAYCTDVNHIPDESLEALGGLDVLVLDALRPRSHPTHFSFDEAVRMARRIGARTTYFTHMTHEVRHAVQEERLPDNIHLGYDGLTFTVKASDAVSAEADT
jgi:phosphoribosyl 1,2-cyclic phosphate phosphodiesterase